MDWLWFTTIISSALAGFVAGHLIATRAHAQHQTPALLEKGGRRNHDRM